MWLFSYSHYLNARTELMAAAVSCYEWQPAQGQAGTGQKPQNDF